MGDLVIKPQEIRRILPLHTEQAAALADPIRVALMDALERDPQSIDELVEALARRGIDKAPTTVRHHVNRLKEAGLVDLVRAEQAGGAVLKYYAANTKVLHYELPDGFDERFAPAIAAAEKAAGDVVQTLMRTQGPELRKAAESLKACPHCSTEHFLEYLLLRVLERGMARALPEAGLAETERRTPPKRA